QTRQRDFSRELSRLSRFEQDRRDSPVRRFTPERSSDARLVDQDRRAKRSRELSHFGIRHISTNMGEIHSTVRSRVKVDPKITARYHLAKNPVGDPLSVVASRLAREGPIEIPVIGQIS